MEDQLKELIVDRLFLDIPPGDITTDTELSEYGVDSFYLLEIIVAIEELFEIRFEQTDINSETLKSISSLCQCIKAKQNT
jgi:acyl carrier protein